MIFFLSDMILTGIARLVFFGFFFFGFFFFGFFFFRFFFFGFFFLGLLLQSVYDNVIYV
jgi:hypothetical protein